ncbi:MAG: response regulator transcription factor [Bacteroidales bacterium]|nr:response regulator transcription factor [Bacteroidales bacterium]
MNNSKTDGEIRCFIIDDEADVRERLKSLLLKIGNICIVGSDEASDKSVELVADLKPEIVFMDIEMPRINGFEAVKLIRSQNCFPTFIFVTAYNQYAIKAIKSAAFDFLLKPVDIEELTETINRFRENISVGRKLNKNLPGYSLLSTREKEVLELMVGGLTSREIAENLFISKNTVDTHRRNILGKVDVKSTIDLFKGL